MKVTATKCFDGKRHSWKDLPNIVEQGQYKYKWCRKCGCIIEVTRRWREDPWKRCKHPDGAYCIEIPKLLS